MIYMKLANETSQVHEIRNVLQDSHLRLALRRCLSCEISLLPGGGTGGLGPPSPPARYRREARALSFAREGVCGVGPWRGLQRLAGFCGTVASAAAAGGPSSARVDNNNGYIGERCLQDDGTGIGVATIGTEFTEGMDIDSINLHMTAWASAVQVFGPVGSRKRLELRRLQLRGYLFPFPSWLKDRSGAL